jgi:methyl halide transferase
LEYWEKRYQDKDTPWALDNYSPALMNLLNDFPDKESYILIPGCGNSKDIVEIIKRGYKNVFVMDISKTALEGLKKNKKIENHHIYEQDFFSTEIDLKFDLIIEQTFFCAINPNRRKEYIDKVHHLLKPNGILGGLFFNKYFDVNPPYGGNINIYKELFSSKFEIIKLELANNSHPSRKDIELFFKFKKK